MSKTRTIEVAALLAATDKDGQVDATRYEAERLILESKRIGGIDADALARAIPASPAFDSDRKRLLETINQQLDTPHERKRLDDALDKANLNDTLGERAAEKVGEAFSGVAGYIQDKAKWIDEYFGGESAAVIKRTRELQNDPHASEIERRSAVLAEKVVVDAQRLYGQRAGTTMHSLNTLKDIVQVGEMGYRFATDENYRDLLISTAKLYAAETMDDPSKPARDLRNATTQALESWEKEYKEAKAQGRGAIFLGKTEGAVGVELVATLIPVSKLGKFGKVANAIDAASPDALNEAVDLANDANRVLRRSGEPPKLHPGETLGEATERIARAAEIAQDVLKAEIKVFRDAGKLDELIEAAHRTGNIEGFLRTGEIAPSELNDMLKRDPSMFAGKVDFQEALDISTNGVDLSKLSTKQLGDIGEAFYTFKLLQDGHTDIVAVKNKSNQGIDIISRKPDGELAGAEIKTSAHGRPEGQSGDPEQFIPNRLQRAIDQQGHWASHNTAPGMDEIARKIREEITDGTGNIVGIEARWVKINVSKSPGSTKLDVDIKDEPWVKREPKKTSLLESLNPDDQTVHRLAVTKGKERGLDDERAENLAAQGLLAFKQGKVVNSPDDVGIYGGRLFISSFPYGKDREPNFHVSVDVASASQKPAQETLQQVAQLDQQQTQERLAQQQSQQQDGLDGPKGPTIGPRIA